jgi:hypothetical protein
MSETAEMLEARAEEKNLIEWMGECTTCGHGGAFLLSATALAPSPRSSCERCMENRRCGTMFWVKVRKQ